MYLVLERNVATDGADIIKYVMKECCSSDLIYENSLLCYATLSLWACPQAEQKMLWYQKRHWNYEKHERVEMMFLRSDMQCQHWSSG